MDDWKRGLERIQPGMYVDARRQVHLDFSEMLAAAARHGPLQDLAAMRLAALHMAADIGAEFHDADET